MMVLGASPGDLAVFALNVGIVVAVVLAAARRHRSRRGRSGTRRLVSETEAWLRSR